MLRAKIEMDDAKLENRIPTRYMPYVNGMFSTPYGDFVTFTEYRALQMALQEVLRYQNAPAHKTSS